MNFFILIPIAITLLIGFFIYRYFISNLLLFEIWSQKNRWVRPLTRLSITILTLLIPVYFIFSHVVFIPLIVKICAYAMGIYFILFITAVLYLLLVLSSHAIRFAPIASSQTIIASEIVILLLAFFSISIGFYQGAQDPIIKKIEVQIPHWQKPNYQIVQLSDIHIGALNDQKFLEKLVTRVNHLNPDLVVITGDLIDASLEYIALELTPLRKLRAPTYAIVGNHEFYNGIDGLKEILAGLNITLLINENIIIDQAFNLIGLSDPTGKRFNLMRPDFKKATLTQDTKLPSILLAHQPVALKLIDHSIDLMLTGHTHGGQIMPFNWPVKLVQPYVTGFHHHSKTQIYVAPGTGFWGPPMRLGTTAEITLFTLNSPSSI